MGLGSDATKSATFIFLKNPLPEKAVGFFVPVSIRKPFFKPDHFIMSTTAIPGSLNRALYQAENPQLSRAEKMEALVVIYREFGLADCDARRAAEADLGSSSGRVALAA